MTAPTESLSLRTPDRLRGNAVVDVAARDVAAAGGSVAAPRKLHPLMAAAAVSVMVLSATGVAALTGLIGPRQADTPAVVAAAAPSTSPVAAQTAPAPVAAMPATDAAPPTEAARPTAAPRPAARPAPHVTAPRAAAPAQAAAPATMPAAPTTPAVQSVPAPIGTAPVEAAPAPAPVAAAPIRAADWGTVQTVREVKVDAQPSAVGTVAGGVLGAVLGHQMGKGQGRDVGTVLGGIGGAFAGRAIESKARATSHWEMTVRLDDGRTRTFSRGSPWAFQAGERVHLVDGQPGRG